MKIIIVILLSFNLLSCISTNTKCDKCLGYWKSEIDQSDKLSRFLILKESDEFIFRALDHDVYLGSNYKSILECKNGKLAINGIPMLGRVDIGVLENETILMMGEKYNRVAKLNENDKYIKISEGEANGIIFKTSKTQNGYIGQFQNGDIFNSSNVWNFIVEDESLYDSLSEAIGKKIKVHYLDVINIEKNVAEKQYIIDKIIEN